MERYWVKPASHWGGVEILHEKIFYPTFLGSLDEELEFVCESWGKMIYFHQFFRIKLFEAGSKVLCLFFFQLYYNKHPSLLKDLQPSRLLVAKPFFAAQVPHPQHVFAPCQPGTWRNLRPVNLQLTGVASTQLGSPVESNLGLENCLDENPTRRIG